MQGCPVPRAKRLRAAIFATLLALAAADSPADEAPGLPEAAAPPATAPVAIDGRELFRVRGVTAYPAEQRARAIEDAIREVADDASIPIDAIAVAEGPASSDVVAGKRVLMRVFDADAALEGVRRETLALVLQRRLQATVESYRHDREPAVLARHAAYAVAASLALVLGLVAASWAWRRLDARLERRYRQRVQSIEIQSLHLVQAERIWGAFRGLLRALRVLAVLLMLWAWASAVLPLFPWTRAHAGRLLAIVLDPMGRLAMGFVDHIPNLVFLALLAIVTRYALRMLHLLSEAVDRGAIQLRSFDREWVWPTYRIARIAVVALALVVAYPYIPGSESDAFKGISILVGLVFSLGSSSVVSNIIAGYSLIYRRTFKLGDRVQIDDAIGEVVEMRLQVTHLRSPKNEEVIVPNSTILASKVVNYSSFARQQGLVLHTTVGIGYEVAWRQVEAMLLLAAERTQGLLREPRPFVLEPALGDFAVSYELNAYCGDARQMLALYSELHRNILDVFNEHGVQIMTPAYESDPAQPKLVPPDGWYAPPARR